ncbi:MAG: Type secretion system domain protein [Candidatus Berkelbacteria bacterium]|nr:Type secretion system domain protein [Candidatus Berkelbacteria bacterium]
MKDIVIFSRVTNKEKVFFARQLAVMISSGVALDNAINLVRLQTRNSAFQKVLTQIYQDIQAGEKLSVSLGKHPKVFDEVFIAVVSSGEATGKLDKVLTHLADRMEAMQVFKSKIKAALAYPIFVVVMMVAVVVLMMIKVIPILKNVFEESGVKLPWSTQLIVATSDFLVKWWWLVLAMLALVILILWLIFTKTKKGRFAWDTIKLKAPLVKYVSYDLYMSRFARTTAMLISSGIPIIETIKITARAINNRVYIRIMKKVIAQVERGIPMSVPLSKEKDVPILVSQMIMVGEQTGRLETLMDKLADYYENEVDTKIKTISNLVEPVTIVIVGFGVGFLIYSILYPIYGLVNVIK